MGVLAGTVAVVTGGGSGIGLATATRLAGAGRVGGRGRPRRGVGRAGGRCIGGLGLQADVGRSDEWPGIVDAVTARFGGIDLAHLNAGVTTGEADITAGDRRRPTGGPSGSTWTASSSACGPWSRPWPPVAAAPIVATASLAGLIGFSPDPIYCLTKHAVVGLVRSLGPQLAEHDITINAVCPSIVDTPLIDDIRGLLEASGFPLIDAGPVSEAVVDRLAGDETGEAMVIQAGREALAFRFARPPGTPGRRHGGPDAARGVRRPRPGLIPGTAPYRPGHGARCRVRGCSDDATERRRPEPAAVSRPGRRRRSRRRCGRRYPWTVAPV